MLSKLSNARKIRSILAMLLVCLMYNFSYAQTQYKVYAGLIFHFVKYTQWPSSSGQVVVGVLGNTQMNSEAMALNGKMAGTAKVVVKNIHDISELSSCQIVFVPSSLSGKYSEVAAKAKQHNVLVVSDSPGATKNGVIINFFEEENKVKFEISNKNAAACGLKISSDLQKLAKVVD